VLLTYKVGNQQFWVTWLRSSLACRCLRRTDSDRLARLKLPSRSFLSIFQLGLRIDQPTLLPRPRWPHPELRRRPRLRARRLQLWRFLTQSFSTPRA